MIELEICGQTYRIASQYDERYLQRIAAHLNAKMDLIQKSSKSRSSQQLLVLTLLDIIDEYFQVVEEKEAVKQRVKESIGGLIERIDERLQVLDTETQAEG